MKRLIAAAVLCAALVLGSVWSGCAVQRVSDAVLHEMENGRFDEAHRTWKAAQTLLGALLLHEEIEQADRLFDRVLAAQEAGLTAELTLDQTELRAQLKHLPELQKPSLKNIL